ncbi:MAG: mechanosensitive ion channel family protein [Bacteroidales bacterium]
MENEIVNYSVLIAGTLVVAIISATFIRKILGMMVNRYSKFLKVDPTNFSFIKNSVGIIIYTIALIFIFQKIPYLKSIGNALFAGVGIITAAIGFASQKAISNMVSGIFILLFKPFKVTDIVEINDNHKGIVEEITLRHTVIRNFENRRIIIPNSIIAEETLINSTLFDEKILKHVVFSISYDSDIDLAIKIIQEEALKHHLLIDNRTPEEIKENVPEVVVRVFALSDFSVDLKAYVWAKDNRDAFVMMCDLYKSVKHRFDTEGIEIPFPYRTLVFKNNPQNGN